MGQFLKDALLWHKLGVILMEILMALGVAAIGMIMNKIKSAVRLNR